MHTHTCTHTHTLSLDLDLSLSRPRPLSLSGCFPRTFSRGVRFELEVRSPLSCNGLRLEQWTKSPPLLLLLLRPLRSVYPLLLSACMLALASSSCMASILAVSYTWGGSPAMPQEAVAATAERRVMITTMLTKSRVHPPQTHITHHATPQHITVHAPGMAGRRLPFLRLRRGCSETPPVCFRAQPKDNS